MLSIETHLLPEIETEAARLKKVYTDHEKLIDDLMNDFTTRFRGEVTDREAIDFCDRVKHMLDTHAIPPDLLADINTFRLALFVKIFDPIINEATQRDTSSSSPSPSNEEPGPRRARNGKPGRPERGDAALQKRVDEMVLENCDLFRLAAELGMDAVGDALDALVDFTDEERPRVMSYISAYLGKSARGPSIGLTGLLRYPAIILNRPSIRMVVKRLLLRDSYDRLMNEGADDPVKYKKVRVNARASSLERMKELGKNANVTAPFIHSGIFLEVSNFLGRACNPPTLPNMVTSVRENDVDCPLPSLRQCIAEEMALEQVPEMMPDGRPTRTGLYVGFEPGKGKTPIAFRAAERIYQERLKKDPNARRLRILYLGPKAVLDEIPNRIRKGSSPKPSRDCYYVEPELAPTVGLVQSKMTTDALAERVCSNDIVFCPYSMLHSKRKAQEDDEAEDDEEEVVPGEEPLEEARMDAFIDMLCDQYEPWDMIVLDEATFIDGNKTWTKLVDRLYHEQKNRPKDKPVIKIAYSGTPVMNTIADPVIVHDLFQSPAERGRRYKKDVAQTQGRDTNTERGMDPRSIRNALFETLLILDEPEKWLDHVDELEYDLSEQEKSFLQGICSNPNLSAKHKIDACMQFILCPQLVSGDDSMPESLFDWATQQLDTDLKLKNAVLISENMRAESVLRTGKKEADLDPNEMDLHFYRRMQKYCEEWSEVNGKPVHFHTVHGKTPDKERQAAYEDAAKAKREGTHKVVILAMSQCLNMGIKLETERMISLEWPYNSPDLQQLLKRALREENIDVRMAVFIAKGTVLQGNYMQSMDKYKDAMELLHGRTISDAMLEKHIGYREEAKGNATTEDSLVSILRHSSPAEKRYEIERWLHGRGANQIKQFWERNPNLWKELNHDADLAGTGDMQRFVGALIGKMIDRKLLKNQNILDINAGGLTLERELRRAGKDGDATVMSVDMLPWMHEEGRAALAADNGGKAGHPACAVSDPDEVHRKIRSNDIIGPFGTAVLRNLHQCNYQSNVLHERARALLSTVKSTEVDGRIVITLPRTACTPEEFQHFIKTTLPLFECMPETDGWYGIARSQDNEGDRAFSCYCVVALKVGEPDESEVRRKLKPDDFLFTHHAAWAGTDEGKRIGYDIRKSRLPSPLRHENYRLGNREMEAATHPKTDARQKQIDHLRDLEKAVRSVHALAKNKTEWKDLNPKRSILSGEGIIYLPQISKTCNKPAFSLKKYPGKFFFPFEDQWNTVTASAAEETKA